MVSNAFLLRLLVVQGSRRSDEEALEEQVRKMGEELREIRDLYDAERDKTMCGEEELLRLHNQVRCAHPEHVSGPALHCMHHMWCSSLCLSFGQFLVLLHITKISSENIAF